jgi:FKBP-type peptidyl-prolyl cis-trans isomerase FklB
MTLYARIGILITVCFVGVQAIAEEQVKLSPGLWLDGYTAGRALAGFHENGDKEEFIRGVLEGISESHDRSLSEDETREAKLAWFGDTTVSKKDQASYAAGYLNGDAYKSPDSLYSSHVFAQGLLDSLQISGAPYVDKQQGTGIVTNYNRSQFYKKKREVADSIKANERAGKVFLANNALQPGVIQSESGLQYRIISPGHGRSAAAEDTVVVSLLGRKIDGQVFHDSQTDASGATTIRVNQSLNGWQEVLVNMSPGAEWELFLPANLAYGNAGWQGVVDPGETLIYDLKLIEVIKAKEAPPRN